ncbi:MAG: succinyldiaminopimelate transaminase [Betaproteobacteria bacterium]|nr:succinyldiaminopimelate transaminase [Betaproteobacteria bacterium]
MDPNLSRLQPYPFQKLATLLAGVTPDPSLRPISLSIGEPKHATPQFIRDELIDQIGGLSGYPATAGSEALRNAMAGWIERRYRIAKIDPVRQVLPVNGSREALFAFAQAVVDGSRERPAVVAPNPFYQIYEGAIILAGAEPHFLNLLPDNGFALDLQQLPEEVWSRTQLIYVCSPGNPTGNVMTLDEWQALFELSDRHGFTIASDECYSEIYFNENRPPLGGLEAAQRLGRGDFRRLVVFSSLSKRSNVPGMRSGFVAGDVDILAKFLLYRTYHGCAMNPAVQAASAAAWSDERHVVENRRLYREKFEKTLAILSPVIEVEMPEAAFYLWLRTPIADTEFTKQLFEQYNVAVVPGSYLAREAHGINPGRNFIRVALVAPVEECLEAAQRLKAFYSQFAKGKNKNDGFAVSHRQGV